MRPPNRRRRRPHPAGAAAQRRTGRTDDFVPRGMARSARGKSSGWTVAGGDAGCSLVAIVLGRSVAVANVAAAVHRRFRRGGVERPLRWPDGACGPPPTLDESPGWLGRAPHRTAAARDGARAGRRCHRPRHQGLRARGEGHSSLTQDAPERPMRRATSSALMQPHCKALLSTSDVPAMTGSTIARRHLEEIAALLGVDPSAFLDPDGPLLPHQDTIALLDLWTRLGCPDAKRRVLGHLQEEVERFTLVQQ